MERLLPKRRSMTEELYSFTFFTVFISHFVHVMNCILKDAVGMFVPKVAESFHRRKDKPHYPRIHRKCAATKRKIWKQLKKRPYDTMLRETYCGCVYRWRKLLVDSLTIFEENLISANNVGAIYRYVNRRITSNCSVYVIVDHCGTQLTDSVLKANAFNKYFVSVGTPLNAMLPSYVVL